jgi:peroxiredoxin
MDAWGKQAGADGKVLMLADGNGDYTKALDLVMDGTGFGLGMRGRRFALIINDGKVEQAFIEEGGQFKVSSADNVLAHL